MTGTVGFRDLQVSCIIGIHERERVMEQPLVVDLEVECDFRLVVASGRVEDGIHYGELSTFVADFLRRGQFGLLEVAGAQLLDALFQEFERILGASLEIRKPDALGGAAIPFVRLRQHRGEVNR